ncbi:hypothetical protein EGW08_017258 [Elysia chlorotica]|uniref:Reverse transcriptase domain-containing protein n=1 Tax=Elysia chlorotica TaxID=188477 RepID=A0A3S1H9Q0_ELYCH|nr:hypothetical protein EGW08_017258 [Elysia chlorotica]
MFKIYDKEHGAKSVALGCTNIAGESVLRAFIDDLASQAEEAAGRGEQGKVYKITKIVAGKYRGTSNAPITDKQGRLLTTESEQEARWTEHFREVLNRPPPTAEADIHFAEVDLDINTEPPEKAEIERAIKSLKSGKAPGQDNLNAELFKVDPALAAEIIKPLFASIWEKKELPKDWTEGIIVKIPKKGARSDCNNWRGITLQDPVQDPCTEWQRQLYINFVDFEKAFDSIHRDSLWRILRAYGIPEKIVLIIKSFYSNFRCRVGNSSTSFEVKTGVRQGCVMSALLFNITIDWVMRRTTEDKSRGIRWNLFSTLEDLDFADDLALLSHTHNHMQEKTARLSNFAKQVGLKINKKKTEVMMLNISNQSPIEVNGENLPTTEEFTYLGSKVRHDGGAGTDIQSRLSKARNSFRMLNNVWRSSQYKVKTKLRLYQSCVLSTLLYGSECWRMTQSDLNKLSTFHTKNLRRILRISWPETISNQHLLARCNQLCMDTIIMQRRWRWLGHVMRKEQGNITRTALHWTPEGRRKRGRPKNTWRRTVESELKTTKHTWSSVQRLAQNRQEWRSFVAALHAMRHNGHE